MTRVCGRSSRRRRGATRGLLVAGGIAGALRPRPNRRSHAETRGRWRNAGGRASASSASFTAPTASAGRGRACRRCRIRPRCRLVRRSQRPQLQPPGAPALPRRATSDCGARTISMTSSSSSTTTRHPKPVRERHLPASRPRLCRHGRLRRRRQRDNAAAAGAGHSVHRSENPLIRCISDRPDIYPDCGRE